jgi:hypothetical protein
MIGLDRVHEVANRRSHTLRKHREGSPGPGDNLGPGGGTARASGNAVRVALLIGWTDRTVRTLWTLAVVGGGFGSLSQSRQPNSFGHNRPHLSVESHGWETAVHRGSGRPSEEGCFSAN